MPRDVLTSIESEYRRSKALGERAMEQLETEQLCTSSAHGASVATLVWHIAGNLKSRFTDFLTSDGEKPWRNRESEFEERLATLEELMAKWEDGWSALFEALAGLGDEDLSRQVTIREEPRSVIAALHRSLAHTSSHVGQIIYVAKMLKGEEWTYLSIPPGGSRAPRD